LRLLGARAIPESPEGEPLEPAALSSLKNCLDPSLGTTDTSEGGTSCGAGSLDHSSGQPAPRRVCMVQFVCGIGHFGRGIVKHAKGDFGRRRPTRRIPNYWTGSRCIGKKQGFGRSSRCTAIDPEQAEDLTGKQSAARSGLPSDQR